MEAPGVRARAARRLHPARAGRHGRGMSEPVWSPCIKVCFVDPARQICVGCFRTMEELGRWTRMSAAERVAVGEALPARRAEYEAAAKG
jgi:uncharacterized protein